MNGLLAAARKVILRRLMPSRSIPLILGVQMTCGRVATACACASGSHKASLRGPLVWPHAGTIRTGEGHAMSKTLILLIVTFGLAFVMFAALAGGMNVTLRSVAAPLKGRALPTIGVLVANFVVVPLGAARAAGRDTRLPAALGTAQKGSQALICSLIFAMGQYSVAGVVALGSSVITVVILVIVAAEIGRRRDQHPRRSARPVLKAEASPPAAARSTRTRAAAGSKPDRRWITEFIPSGGMKPRLGAGSNGCRATPTSESERPSGSNTSQGKRRS